MDANGDGRFDRLLLDIEMPLKDSENVIGVKLLTVYYYRLKVWLHLCKFSELSRRLICLKLADLSFLSSSFSTFFF